MDVVMENVEAVDRPSTSYAERTALWTDEKVALINVWRVQLDQFVQQLVDQDGFQTVTHNYKQLQEFNTYWVQECGPYDEAGWPTGEQFQKV